MARATRRPDIVIYSATGCEIPPAYALARRGWAAGVFLAIANANHLRLACVVMFRKASGQEGVIRARQKCLDGKYFPADLHSVDEGPRLE